MASAQASRISSGSSNGPAAQNDVVAEDRLAAYVVAGETARN